MSTPSYIDFRSDTVTHPTPEMRQAMAEAPVGDDVYGDDPTVLALQALGAKLLNKEAALFVPSGTMGNLLAAMVHCSHRGSEMIVGKESHMHYYEQGNSATLAGIHSRTVRNLPDGSMPLDEIEALIRPLGDDHFPVTKLICLENTQNRCGGVCLSPEYIDSVGVLAQKHKLALHMDGARLFNAAIGSGYSAARLVAACDSISFCLSKALAAPVGSLLVGSAAFILQAKKYRKALGGGMRQAGIIAAAGIVALNKMVDRLADDHKNAHTLATSLATIPGITLDLSTVQTNIVYINLDAATIKVTAVEIRDILKSKYGILITAMDARRIRFVTHWQITSQHIQQVLTHLKTIIQA